jgi:hypothetical protein
MAASEALRAKGSLLKIETTTGVYVEIAELRDWSFAMVSDEIQNSIHNDVQSWKNYLPATKSAEISLQANYLPFNDTHDYASTSGLLYHFANGTKKNWQMTFVGSPAISMAFVAFARNFTINAPVDGELNFNAVLRVDGAPTLS